MPEFIAEFTPDHLDDFTRGYLDAAEWLLSDSDDVEGGVADRDRAEGWSDEAVKEAIDVCADFQEAVADRLTRYREVTGRDMGSAGIDFWLTRNRHGAGFWDRGSDSCLKELSDAARAYGGCDTYVGDDGLIYFG